MAQHTRADTWSGTKVLECGMVCPVDLNIAISISTLSFCLYIDDAVRVCEFQSTVTCT